SSSNALDRYGFKALLAPGLNRVAVSALIAGKGGNYSLNATAAAEDITCELLEAVVTTPIITSQQLAADDCSSGSFLEDRLEIGLPPNASITASMTTGAFQPHLRLLSGITDEVVAEATASGSATLVFANGNAPKTFSLVLTSEVSGSSGPYTLSLNVTNPPAVA